MISTSAPPTHCFTSMRREAGLPPTLLPSAVCAGAAVFELLPYNWQWQGLAEMVRNLTRSMGDVHYAAWRACSAACARYSEPGDARYGTWTMDECSSRRVCVCWRVRQAGGVDKRVHGSRSCAW